MDTKSVERTAFALGYMDGRRFKTEFSRKQAECKLRGLHDGAIECYLNGRSDGVKGDPFRYNLTLAEQRSQS